MYTLIVDCFTFSLQQQVHIVDEMGRIAGTLHMSLDKIADFLYQDSRITTVKLAGVPEFCRKIQKDLQEQLVTDYEHLNREIKIEVL